MSVSTSGYYAWIKRGRISRKKQEDLTVMIQFLFRENKQRYTSKEYQKVMVAHGFQVSMSTKGDCWDNTVAESFFKTLKTESLNHLRFKTRKDVHFEIISYLSWYNSKRMHSSIGYLSPMEYETLNQPLNQIA